MQVVRSTYTAKSIVHEEKKVEEVGEVKAKLESDSAPDRAHRGCSRSAAQVVPRERHRQRERERESGAVAEVCLDLTSLLGVFQETP